MNQIFLPGVHCSTARACVAGLPGQTAPPNGSPPRPASVPAPRSSQRSELGPAQVHAVSLGLVLRGLLLLLLLLLLLEHRVVAHDVVDAVDPLLDAAVQLRRDVLPGPTYIFERKYSFPPNRRNYIISRVTIFTKQQPFFVQKQRKRQRKSLICAWYKMLCNLDANLLRCAGLRRVCAHYKLVKKEEIYFSRKFFLRN